MSVVKGHRSISVVEMGWVMSVAEIGQGSVNG